VENDHLSAEQVAAYIDGALSHAERARVEGHLVRCHACLAELLDLLRDIRRWGPQRSD
jgi:anti-sigma factor RsiW